MLNLQYLRVLVELSNRGTIAAVSAATGFASSTISQQLGQLEREAGVELLRRSGRNVSLTHAGEELCQHAVIMLAEHDRAVARLTTWKVGVRKEVRLCLPTALQTRFLAELMFGMADQDDQLRVVVSDHDDDQALRLLAEGELDLVVTTEYPGLHRPVSTRQRRHELVADELFLVGAPEWQVDSLSMIDPYPWVMAGEGTPLRIWTESLLRTVGVRPQVQYVTDSMALQTSIAARGLGLAILPSLAVSSGSAVHLAHLPDRPGVLHCAWTATPHRPGVEFVRSAVAHHLREASRRSPAVAGRASVLGHAAGR